MIMSRLFSSGAWYLRNSIGRKLAVLCSISVDQELLTCCFASIVCSVQLICLEPMERRDHARRLTDRCFACKFLRSRRYPLESEPVHLFIKSFVMVMSWLSSNRACQPCNSIKRKFPVLDSVSVDQELAGCCA